MVVAGLSSVMCTDILTLFICDSYHVHQRGVATPRCGQTERLFCSEVLGLYCDS